MGHEEWKHIEGHPNYKISNTGRLKSKARGDWRDIRSSEDRYGYEKVVLCTDGSSTYKTVHQLVAKAFVDGYEPGLQINHINGNKHDNRAENLEWVTVGDNIRHAYNTGLNHGPCKKVRIVETNEIYDSEVECAKAVNGQKSGVNGCLRGRRRTHKGYHYEYIDEMENQYV